MWFNPIMRSLLKSPLHFFISQNTMLLTYRGRKSGRSYTTPVSFLEVNGTLYTISSRDRVWWRNLRGGGDVTLLIKGRPVPARSEVIEEQGKVKAALIRYLRQAPERAKYFDVRRNEAGNPLETDITKLAEMMVVVSFEAVFDDEAVPSTEKADSQTTQTVQEG